MTGITTHPESEEHERQEIVERNKRNVEESPPANRATQTPPTEDDAEGVGPSADYRDAAREM